LTAKASFPLGSISVYGSVGPYLGFGLAGNIATKVTYGELSETGKRSIQWGSEQGADDFERYNYGATFGAGVKVQSFKIGVSYNLGLANLSPASESGSKINSSALEISIGYMFGKSKKAEHGTQMDEKSQEVKKVENTTSQTKGKKAAAIEAERIRLEKVRTDSIAAVKAEEERIRIEKAEAERIEAARIIAETKASQEAVRRAKIKADSIYAAQNSVIYRVQFASSTVKKGSYTITVAGKKFSTWEYSYSGAYRSTVGEFTTYKSSLEFQKLVRQSGYSQAFVVAFKNNIRVTDPALFK
jgi:hypothetical protein